MKNILIILGLSLSFTLACSDKEKSEEAAKAATGPEAEAKEACTCIHTSLGLFDKPAEMKKAQEKCTEALEKKYKGKGSDDEKTVEKIMNDCEKDFKEKLRKVKEAIQKSVKEKMENEGWSSDYKNL